MLGSENYNPLAFLIMAIETTSDEKKEAKTQEGKHALALKRFKNIHAAELENRENSLEDLKFVYNIGEGQWPEEIRDEREAAKRPALTSNKLRKFVAQVANQERDQRLAGDVRPVDDAADVETAKILAGMIRQIEYTSDAEVVYTDGGEKALAGGFGYWRILAEETPDSFDQEVFIRPIPNQFSVYLDPRRKYGFIRVGMPKEEFEEMFPGRIISDFESQSQGEEWELWYLDEIVFIAEYFYKETYMKTIAQCQNILTGDIEIHELTDKVTPELLAEKGLEILRTKESKAERVKWMKLSGAEILEENDWAGKEIPIIEVKGDEVNIAGRFYKRSLIRDAKDPQRMYNFWLTHMTETVALAPKAPYLVTPQQIKGHKSTWDRANRDNLPYLPYNPDTRTKAAPRREPPPTIPTGSAQMLQIAGNDVHDNLGKYEASFGEASNERTGVAIRQRANRSDFATYHFPDNFRRAILETARQLIDIIPKIYDTQRMVRIIGDEDKEEVVEINKTVIDIPSGEKVITNDLSKGKYDVVASTKIWSTRRQEAADQMAAVMQAAPNIAPLIADLVFKYNDWPGAQEIQERLEKYLPTLLGEKTNTGEPGGGQ